MNKYIRFFLTIGLISALTVFGCENSASPETNAAGIDTEETVQETVGSSAEQAPDQLTLDKVVELSSKGEELNWSDFKEYHGLECGSGLYVVRFRIDDDYELVMGGDSLENKPMYINLVRKGGTDDSAFIDIRSEDVQAFIDAAK